MDAIYGVTMDQLAEYWNKEGELRAKFGEPACRGEFESYLASNGLDMNTWALAWNGWHDRWKNDPTGRLEATFHMKVAELSNKTHFADVRDMSADTEEGISLDQYAQIVVAVSRQGANADEIVKQFGLQDVDHWQRANAAWTKKMGEDASHKLTMQYGQLYGKYAGPQFQEEQLAQTAAILADNHKPRDVVDEPKEELTPELCLEKMKSPSRNERWKFAPHYARMIDLNHVADKAAGIMTVTPILLEMIERHDDNTTSDAESGARWLWDLGVRGDDFHGAVARCLARAKESLASHEAAFAPIRDQAVPERIFIQAKIQDFTSLVSTMTDYMNEDWSVPGAAMAPVASPAMGGAPMGTSQAAPIPYPSTPMTAPPSSGGFPKWLLAPVILAVVGGGLFYMRSRSAKAEAEAQAAAIMGSASASAAASTAPLVTATPSAAATPAAHPAAAPASAAGSAKPGKKPAAPMKKK